MKQNLVDQFQKAKSEGKPLFGGLTIEEMAGYYLEKSDPILMFEHDRFEAKKRMKTFYWQEVEKLIRDNA